jgi:hypothetical protein
MRKIYRKLTKEQLERGVVFSSCLSIGTTEREGDNIHEVFNTEDYNEKSLHIRRLKDDKFFNGSQWKYNIIRS